MTQAQRCPAVPEGVLASAIAANRTRYQAMLSDSCARTGVEISGPVGTVLAERLDAFLDHFLPTYTRADLSARHHHRAYSRASTMVFALGAAAVVIVAAQSLFHLPHWIIAGEVLCIVAILFAFHWGNHRRWHRNWVDCRYFAERLRCGLQVAFLCGKTVVSAAPAWSDRMVEGSWCNPEYRAVMGSRPRPDPSPPAGLPVLRDFLVTHWLAAQAAYHRSVSVSKLHRHNTVSRIGEACFWMTLVAALLHLTPHGWRQAWHADRLLTDRLLTFAVIALPAVGTALAGVRGHFEFKKIALRSRMIAEQLDSMIERARAVDDVAGLTLVVLQAEELMIQENAGWHLHANSKSIPSEA